MPAARSFSEPALEDFRRRVRAWAEEAAPRHRLAPDAGEETEVALRRRWEQEVWRAGFQCLSWPVELGGGGLGPLEEFVFAEECARAGAPEGLGRVARLLAGPALLAHGNPEQRARLLPAIIEGRETWCQGFSEPNAGSDLAAVGTTARLEGDAYVVSGQKAWTSFGHYADRCLLLARTGDAAQRHRSLSLFAMTMRQPGVSVRPLRQANGRWEFVELFLDGAAVPVGDRIGPENAGWEVAMTILNAERGGGFAAVFMQRIAADLRLYREHCRVGQPGVEAATALADRLEVVRWQVMRALEQLASGAPATASLAVLKLAWSELSQEVARAGLRAECPKHRDWWRFREIDTREATISSGSSEIQRNLIADRILGLPR